MIFQLGGTLLEACVLAVLMQEDTYGYVLTQRVREIVDISESTLYPVLRRLQKEGCLVTYDEPYQGRNRRYYHITDSGKSQSNRYISEWKNYKERVDQVLLGGNQVE